MQQRAPLFSIVIPTRNRAHLLPRALRSALEQTLDDYEIVIVANDCRDDTKHVVEETPSKRVRYYESGKTLTMPENWELAWTKARGTYVLYLPDDDALVPTALEVLAEHALDGRPQIVSWEDAPYYYPDWHDPRMQNLLLLFPAGQRLVEDVPAEAYRQQCAQFSFAWSSPLPKLLNCAAERETLETWRQKLGRLFFPVAPDYSFAWIVSHIYPSIRVVHRPLNVRGISDHSIGSNAGLGGAGSEFLREFGEFDFFAEAPIQLPVSLNHLAATFLRASVALKSQGISPSSLDLERFVVAAARQFKESEHLIPNWSAYVPELLSQAEAMSKPLRERIERVLAAPTSTAVALESIREVRARTARMAMEYAPNLQVATKDHLGDSRCARCLLGLEVGLLAGSQWDCLYIFGDEIGVADPYGMSRYVDRYYDLLLQCRQKRARAHEDESSMQQVDASAFYDQDTEVELLTKLLGRLGNKTVMDVGAEKGTFVKALVQAGAEAVYAFEPFPASVEKLRADFGDMPAVHIFDVALGARDETVQLHLVQDKTGEHEDAFHSLVAFDETPTLRTVGEIPVQCRTLQSLLDERAIPKDIGILKVDTERGDFEVLKGLGDVVGDVVMIEYWDNLPETVGAPAYRVAEVATFMAERGYANFLVIKRHDQFEVLQLNSTDTRPGDWGNVMFIHDRVFGQVAPLIYQAVERAQIRLLDRAKFFADEANERLTSVERLTRESDERLAVMAAMQSEAEKRLTLMDEMQEAAARERGRTVLTRLETILEQEAALDAYLQTRHDEGLWQWVTPQIGVLYQHPPMPFQIPEHYLRVPFLPKPPVISIVTPTLNSAQFLPHTINSVLDQEYPALEYIIQDGDSTDETSSILEQYRPRLKHAASEKDNGMAQAINRGFAHATGDVMAYLNSDDMLLPGTLNFVAAYFEENPRVDVVYGHRVLIDAFNAEIGRWVLPSHDDAMLTWADFVPQETLFWRRSIWEKAGGQMDESFKFALDWDLLLRFREAGAVMTRLPRFLAAFRVHPGQKTAVELNEVGLGEMNRLRERQLGRLISDEEVWRYLEGFMRRHKVYHKLYRLGVLRY